MLNLVLVALGLSMVLGHPNPWRPLPHHFATARSGFRTARPPLTNSWRDDSFRLGLMLSERSPERPPSRPIRLNPFASSDPLAKHRAVTGINVHVRWYQRVRSLVGIVVLVLIMGVLVAAAIGVAFFATRIVLELLVG